MQEEENVWSLVFPLDLIPLTGEILPLSIMTCPWGIWFTADLWICRLSHVQSDQPLLQGAPHTHAGAARSRLSYHSKTYQRQKIFLGPPHIRAEAASGRQTLLCCNLQTAFYFLKHFSLKSGMKFPLWCFLFLSLDLKEGYWKTYFSKDKNEKEHYFKFVTQRNQCETLIANK